MGKSIKKIAAFFCAAVMSTCAAFAATRITVVGDSISQGIGIPEKERAEFCYPAQLGKILEGFCVVENCSMRGSNIVAKGFRPYMKQKCYKRALESKPDVVLVLLGANDGHCRNWKFKDDFERDYNALLDSFANLDTRPQIILGIPLPCFIKGNPKAIDGGVLRNEITPIIEKIAKKRGLKTVDFYALFADKKALMPDKIHPNKEGAAVMAQFLAKWLVENGVVKVSEK